MLCMHLRTAVVKNLLHNPHFIDIIFVIIGNDERLTDFSLFRERMMCCKCAGVNGFPLFEPAGNAAGCAPYSANKWSRLCAAIGVATRILPSLINGVEEFFNCWKIKFGGMNYVRYEICTHKP